MIWMLPHRSLELIIDLIDIIVVLSLLSFPLIADRRTYMDCYTLAPFQEYSVYMVLQETWEDFHKAFMKVTAVFLHHLEEW